VFIQDEKDFLVLVNFEDHLTFIVLPNKLNPNDGLNQGIQRTIRLIQAFEKLGFATDPYLGNLTVNPSNLGTAMKLEISIPTDEFETHKLAQKEKELKSKVYNESRMVLEMRDGICCVATEQTLAHDLNEANLISDFLE
jgi:protein-arginine kinase